MAFPLINAWAVGDLLTSTQMNTVAVDLTHCLDKTGDGVASSPSGGITGAIDILSTGTLRLVNVSNIPVFTLSGSTLEGSSLATLQMDVDSQFNTSGTTTFLTGSNLNMNSGSNLNIVSGVTATINLNAASSVTIAAPTTFNATTITVGSGCTLTMGGANLFGTVTTAVANYFMGNGDTFVLADTSSIAVNVHLPAAQSGKLIVVKDKSGTAATHNITITPAAGLIDGAATKTISSAYKSIVLTSDGSNWFQLAQF